jgi:hypothetical protein
MVSASKQDYIERSIAFHSGVLKCQFEWRKLDENLIENTNETHFIINYDNRNTFEFKGDKHIKLLMWFQLELKRPWLWRSQEENVQKSQHLSLRLFMRPNIHPGRPSLYVQ